MEQRQRVGDQAQKERAKRGAVHRAGTAEDVHASHHHRRDHLQHDTAGGGGIDRPEACAPQHARGAGEHAAHREHQEADQAGADAENRGRFGIAADRVHLAPEARLLQQQTGDRDDDHRQHNVQRHAQYRRAREIDVFGWQIREAHLPAAGQQEREPAIHGHRAQRGDDGRHAEHAHDHSVDNAQRQAEGDAVHQRQRDR